MNGADPCEEYDECDGMQSSFKARKGVYFTQWVFIVNYKGGESRGWG